MFFCFGTLPTHQHRLPPQCPVSKQLRNANLTERSNQSKTRVNRWALHYARNSSCLKCLNRHTWPEGDKWHRRNIRGRQKSFLNFSCSYFSSVWLSEASSRAFLIAALTRIGLWSPEFGLKVSRKEPVNIGKKALYVIKASFFSQLSAWTPGPQRSEKVDSWGQGPGLQPPLAERRAFGLLLPIYDSLLVLTDCSCGKTSICSSWFFHSLLDHLVNWQL